MSKKLRTGAVATCVAITALSISAVTFAAPAAADDQAGAPPSDMAAATAQAQASGQPVEVSDKTTETSQVMANPDGTFTLTSNRNPVRVKQNDIWRPIDTSLHLDANGLLKPTATTTDYSFSGGGTAPLVELRDGDKSVAYTWPHALPAPTVAGDTATYASVMPGVDLKVKALPEGYDETLVVNNAQAAADPALQNLTLTEAADGLKVLPSSNGTSDAVDSSGQTVFQGGTPVMWDSSNDTASQVGGPATTFDPGNGDVTPLAVSASTVDGLTSPAASTITLSPPASALTGTDVHYPVYIDPEMDGSLWHWAVTFNGGSHFYDGGIEDFKVGYCDFSDCGNWYGQSARSYFQFGINDIAGSGVVHIYSADVAANELHGSQGCTPEPVRLFPSSNINATNTAWPGPYGATVLDTESSAAGDNCGGAGYVDFQNANVVSYVQNLASTHNNRANFALFANVENNDVYWKRFDENPKLTVHYNFYPDPPTEIRVNGEVDCTGTHYVNTATPSLVASDHDNNPTPLRVQLTYQVFAAGNTTTALVTSPRQTAVPSDSQQTWTLPSPIAVAPGGSSYQFQTSVVNVPPDPGSVDPLPARSPAAFYPFTILPAPTIAASATSLDYPANNWGLPGGSITLSDGGALNTVGYAYGWDSPSNIPALAATTCNYNQITANGGLVAGSHTVTITVPTNLPSGPHTLWVRSFDAAHNMSPTPSTATYSLLVPPAIVGEGTVKTEAESAGAIATGGSVSTVSVPSDSNGQELQLTGTAGTTTADLSFSTNVEGDDAIGIELVDGPGNGQLTFAVDKIDVNQPDGTALTANTSAGSRSLVWQPLGGRHLGIGTHHLTINLIGGSQAAFDFLTAIPINGITPTSFSAAMNNRAIADDGATAANIAMSSPGGVMRGYSSQALATAGWSANSIVTVGGATFTMPARNSVGNDNVIATGQTIPVPNPNPAHPESYTAMGFVVASVCRAAGAPANTGTFNYTDGSTSVARFPAIPDWSVGSTTTAALNLSAQELGTAQDTSSRSAFYVVFAPTDPTKILQSITLPNYGTNFLPCAPAVHVFAMAAQVVATGWEGAWAAPIDSTSTAVGGANLANQTIRVITHPTVTGPQLRIRLSNMGNTSPATIDAATVAAQATSNDAATTTTPQAITFCTAKNLNAGCTGGGSITIPAGGEVFSDAITAPSGGSGNLAISLHLPAAITAVPTHTVGNNTTYVGVGNQVSATATGGFGYTTNNSYFLTGVDFMTGVGPNDGTTVILGDSTSANGYSTGSSTYKPTWIDDLPADAAANGSPLVGGIVNASLQNKPTSWWATPDASGTVLDADVMDEPNVRNVVISLGAADVLTSSVTSSTVSSTAVSIENNIKALVLSINNARYGVANYARADGSGAVPVILTTIPALGLSSSDPREALRQAINQDILNYWSSYNASSVVDIDTATADPNNPSQLAPSYLTGGVPNASYYLAIADTFANQEPPLF